MHYQAVIEHPRYEDFEIERFNKNIWAHLGMGWTVPERRRGEPVGTDCSPYLNLNNIDPKWCVKVLDSQLKLYNANDTLYRYEAMGGDPKILRDQQNDANAL